MFRNRNRKRKLSSDHSASYHEDGSRRSQRPRATPKDRHEARSSPSSSQLSPPPPEASLRRRRDLDLVRPCSDENEHGSLPHSEAEQKKEFTFFSFPGEIRNIIYDYSLHYPDSRQLYAPYYRRPAFTKVSPTWKPRLRAPTILLLNKRITSECLPMLKSTTLVIDRLPPPKTILGNDKYSRYYHCLGGHAHLSHFMRLSDFISPRTLQNVPQIKINVGLCEGPLGSGWAWVPVVEELLSILTQRNTCVKLRMLVRLCNPRDYPTVAHSDRDHQIYMIKKLKKFANVNPNVFARREVKVDLWKVEGQKATFVSAKTFPEPVLVLEDGEAYELERPEEKPVPAPRMYPDKEMFPGSVMEFVKPAPPPYYSYDESN